MFTFCQVSSISVSDLDVDIEIRALYRCSKFLMGSTLIVITSDSIFSDGMIYDGTI